MTIKAGYDISQGEVIYFSLYFSSTKQKTDETLKAQLSLSPPPLYFDHKQNSFLRNVNW